MKSIQVFALLAASSLIACKGASGPTPAEVEAGATIANGACQLLEGVTQNQTIVSICATIEEIALIAGFVATLVRHGQAADAGACTILAGTTICATSADLGQAISMVLAKRDALLVRDRGAQ